jgi:simple sugar transport system permease protein
VSSQVTDPGVADDHAVTTMPAAAIGSASMRSRFSSYLPLAAALIGIVIFSLSRDISDTPGLTSTGMAGVALRTAMPIAMAGLAGLYAERSGTVNIGIEGMMVMGTIFAGWWGWQWGPWVAVVGGIVGGILGGLLHALATVTFGVNHIVSGVAINLIAPGVARFMANALFTDTVARAAGGSVTSSPNVTGDMPHFTMPFTSGGTFFGVDTWDPLGWLEKRQWFVISDLAGLLRGLTRDLTLDVIIGAGFIVLAWYILWRTPFGLRMRAAGEKPSAPDSLGVSVRMMRYQGMILSGAMAGFGGALLVFSGSQRYQEGQTGGRGFLGLATLIFGNWRPSGLAAGAGLFGYAQGIDLRVDDRALVRAVILASAIGLAVATLWLLMRAQRYVVVGALVVHTVLLLAHPRVDSGQALIEVACVVLGVAVAVLLGRAKAWRELVPYVLYLLTAFAYIKFPEPNNQAVYIFPFVVTLVVVSARSQSLRPPAAAGIPYFKGQQG